MKTDLINRLLELAIILYSSEFKNDGKSSITKLYTDYYARFNSKTFKLPHKKAFIQGPSMMKKFFEGAITDNSLSDNTDKAEITVNLRSTFVEEIVEIFSNKNEFFANYPVADKGKMVLTLIGIDQLLLSSQFEYGPKAINAILNGLLANTGQWWAVMELSGFSTSAFAHANKLLHTTKNSNLSHQLNGASALFPTNMTYARFSDIVRGSPEGLTLLHTQFLHIGSSNFAKYSNMSDEANDVVNTILRNYMFHIIALINTETYRFNSFYIGYYNFWRYNNSILYKNMNKIINVK